MARIIEDKWSMSKEQGSGAVRMCYYSQIQQMLRVIKELVKKSWLHAETTKSKNTNNTQTQTLCVNEVAKKLKYEAELKDKYTKPNR